MATNTTIPQSSGNKIKQMISPMSQEERTARAKAVNQAIIRAITAPETDKENTADFLTSIIEALTANGVDSDIEYFEDACRQIKQAFEDKDYGRGCFNTLPKFTRNNIMGWLSQWEHMFTLLSMSKRIEAVLDRISTEEYAYVEEADLLALEAKYLNQE